MIEPNTPLRGHEGFRCLEIESLLADYIDQQLPPTERAMVEAHLASCPACKEFAADIQAATQFIGKVPSVEPPPELVTRIIFETQSGRHGSFAKGNWLQRGLEVGVPADFAAEAGDGDGIDDFVVLDGGAAGRGSGNRNQGE